jgi:tetratricopeptide (TPR) repeat protein
MRVALTFGLSLTLVAGSIILPAVYGHASGAGPSAATPWAIGVARADDRSATPGADAKFPVCTTPPRIDNDLAASAYRTGRDFFEKRVYNKALERFLEAYESDCTKHDLLIIISRTYESMGNYRDAIRALRTLFERKGRDVEDRPTLEKRIESLEADLKKQQADGARISQLEAEKRRLEDAEKRRIEAERNAADDQGMQPLPKWLLIGGGASATVGVALHVVAIASVPKDCSVFGNSCDTLEAQKQANESSATTFRNLGWVFLGAGAVAAGTGLVLHLTADKAEAQAKPAQPTARLTPTWTPGYAGLTLAGGF